MSQSSKGTTTGQGMNDITRFNIQKTTNVRVKSRLGIGWLVFAAAILLLVPALGFAQDDSEPGDRPSFVDRFDQNGDESVSQDEFPGPAEHFSDLDSDGDGFIDAGEAPERPPKGRRGGFERDDQDDDGRVSQDEFSGPSDHFDALDQNQDGYIDRDEAPRGPRGGGRGGHGPRN